MVVLNKFRIGRGAAKERLKTKVATVAHTAAQLQSSGVRVHNGSKRPELVQIHASEDEEQGNRDRKIKGSQRAVDPDPCRRMAQMRVEEFSRRAIDV